MTNIKNLRKTLRLTQEQFAKELEISVFAVRSWEQGLKKPSRRTRVKLTKLLNKEREVGDE